ncbi:type II toxin-antitoxin system RelE family toxin [Lederbergia citrea]|uniref:Type II toxin-antitoxin system RelE/ParE family toxin n=2 Tax=Lederbergia citrea TaxID=2833581 RepID=A0A942Z5Y7_9BACI|nr:type II toxin-antitoxin system RelE/ParE family toxin [Lederbergia citrea]MBS4205744.1 type II toxin-antitoxin system RelE/ParE family toxin [Lederbergia citrea]MBS4223920.1 type II toxin-antitoxin system RelE/ParE family toxin [Lederbergia citrea]
MIYNIELSKRAEKYLRNLDKKTRTRIYNHIKILSENPRHPELDIKKIQGHENLYRQRLGDYRVLYSIMDEILLIIIVKIGSRGDVYK